MPKNAIIVLAKAGKTYEDIVRARSVAAKELEKKEPYNMRDNLVETRYPDDVLDKMGVVNKPMFLLSKVLESMAGCDLAYFTPEWENDEECKTAHTIALQMNLEVID